MNQITASAMLSVEVMPSAGGGREQLLRDVSRGLSAEPKELPPKYFYDERGSQLFEQITELDEYYPTRCERSLLIGRGEEILCRAGFPRTLVELGSGSAAKTRHLLDAMSAGGCLGRFVAVDISEEITHATGEALIAEYPGLEVRGLVCDFEQDIECIGLSDEPRMIAFLGGTIGNLYPDARRDFLRRLAAVMGPRDRLLLGTDLIKERSRLELAYDDPAGVTAAFNKNVLAVLNRELGADFELADFEHVVRYDDSEARMDIGLRSLRRQRVRIADLGIDVDFDDGEEMRTEISAKFTRHSVERAYAEAGLELTDWLPDSASDFALSLARAPRSDR